MGEVGTAKWVKLFILQSLPDLEDGWMGCLFLLFAPPVEPV